MKQGFWFLVLSLAMIVGTSARAAESTIDADTEKYFTIKSVNVEEVTTDDVALTALDENAVDWKVEVQVGNTPVPTGPGPVANPVPYPGDWGGYGYPGGWGIPGGTAPGGTAPGGAATPAPAPKSEAQVMLDSIVNIAKSLWAIIKENKPVANFKTDHANAIPMGVNAANWTHMSGWKAPMMKTYRVTYKNGFDSTVVDFTFRLSYLYGGMYKGKGKYLMNATMVPANLDVAWGYTFNAQAAIDSISNAGTAKKPVAAMQLSLRWSVDTILKHMESTENFYILGTGEAQDTTEGRYN